MSYLSVLSVTAMGDFRQRMEDRGVDLPSSHITLHRCLAALPFWLSAL